MNQGEVIGCGFVFWFQNGFLDTGDLVIESCSVCMLSVCFDLTYVWLSENMWCGLSGKTRKINKYYCKNFCVSICSRLNNIFVLVYNPRTYHNLFQSSNDVKITKIEVSVFSVMVQIFQNCYVLVFDSRFLSQRWQTSGRAVQTMESIYSNCVGCGLPATLGQCWFLQCKWNYVDCFPINDCCQGCLCCQRGICLPSPTSPMSPKA